jgi:putative transposase
MPDAMPSQNRRRSSRRATGGRPGDNNGGRPDRAERRFRLVIATPSLKVLRRPVEFTQYCAIDYHAELEKHGILISMSGKGNCYDNAMVETFFKTLKSELVWRTIFYTRIEAEDAIARYIDGFYNPVRRHSALDFISPVQFEKRATTEVMPLH